MKSFKYWLSIGFITLLLLVFIELFVRLCFPMVQAQGCAQAMMKDFIYGDAMGLAPNGEGIFFGKIIHSDAHRCRKNAQVFDRKKKSWLHLGDSVTLGVGVVDDSCFSARIAAQIDSVNVLNLSLVGYAVSDYQQIVNQLLIKEQNDLNINHITLFYCLNDIDRLPFKQPTTSYKILDFVRANYITFIALKGLFFDRPSANYNYDMQHYKSEDTALAKTANMLFAIDSTCEAHQIKLEMICLPYQASLADAKSRTQTFDILKTAIHKRFQQSGVATDLPMYNAADAFKMDEDDDYTAFYLYGDALHFSPAGHFRIAQYCNEVLH